MVLEEYGQDQLDRSRGNSSITYTAGGKKILHTHTIKSTKVNWIGHILRRNCLLKHVIRREMIVGTRSRGRRLKKLLNDLKKERRCWTLKEETLDHNL